jgi:hypothetical protein
LPPGELTPDFACRKYSEFKDLNPTIVARLLDCRFYVAFPAPGQSLEKNSHRMLTMQETKRLRSSQLTKSLPDKMFRSMKKYLPGVQADNIPELKSRNGSLSEGERVCW